jgi:hypothetical protein
MRGLLFWNEFNKMCFLRLWNDAGDRQSCDAGRDNQLCTITSATSWSRKLHFTSSIPIDLSILHCQTKSTHNLNLDGTSNKLLIANCSVLAEWDPTISIVTLGTFTSCKGSLLSSEIFGDWTVQTHWIQSNQNLFFTFLFCSFCLWSLLLSTLWIVFSRKRYHSSTPFFSCRYQILKKPI